MPAKPSSSLPTEPVNRRGLVARLVAAAAAGAAVFNGEALAAAPDVPRVAYHLSDMDKVAFVLGNIANHIEGMGGPDKVAIVLVVHGPALNAFRQSAANPDIVRKLSKASAQGVGLEACGNTLKAQKLTLAELLPGFVQVDQGGVTRLAQLQAEGYAYLRP
ncbi:MAG: DsrE family protein [Devosia sp.]|nr:DsrE family protein [Devosia sp.]